MKRSAVIGVFAGLLLTGFHLPGAPATTAASPVSAGNADSMRSTLPDVLSPPAWSRLEQSVDRALAWMAAQQQANGAFPSADAGQPAITSLCVLAFLSRGHQPGAGPYGPALNRAIDFVLQAQQPDGMFTYLPVEAGHVHLGASHTAIYNHAIAGLMLTEVYGGSTGDRARRIKAAVEKALQVTVKLQSDPPKADAMENGGWRYVRKYYGGAYSDSDLSVTAWHLMFLRSAKNAEFKVSDEAVGAAMGYIERCFDPSAGVFCYSLRGSDRFVTRSMQGAGVLSLSLGGKHQTPMARQAGNWVLAHPFTDYGATIGFGDRYFYALYYCSQAMAQLGGRHWETFFPQIVQVLLQHQSKDGAWTTERGEDYIFGEAYTTSLAVLALTAPYQLLPIYQR